MLRLLDLNSGSATSVLCYLGKILHLSMSVSLFVEWGIVTTELMEQCLSHYKCLINASQDHDPL